MTQGPPALASPAAVSLAAAVPDRDGSGAHTADEVDDPDQASSLLATVYSPNRLSVLGPRAAFRMRWRRDALGPMLLSTLSFDTEVELRQQIGEDRPEHLERGGRLVLADRDRVPVAHLDQALAQPRAVAAGIVSRLFSFPLGTGFEQFVHVSVSLPFPFGGRK